MNAFRVVALVLAAGLLGGLCYADYRDQAACERAGGLYLLRVVTTADGTRTDCIAAPTAVEYDR